MTRSLTSNDAVLAITIEGVYPSPVVLQGWATDDIFTVDPVAKTETRFGLDGVLSAGYVKHPRKLKLKLEASSESQQVFDDWASAMDQAGDAIPCNMALTLNSNGTKYACTRGFLGNYKDVPDAKVTLQPLEYEITFQSIEKARM